MDLKNITIDSKEVGKLVGIAKRSFTNAKKRVRTIVVDQIEDYENELFAEDYELAKLVKAKQILDNETKERKKELDDKILERINKTLITKRGYDAEELYDKRESALLELLKDALHEFTVVDGYWASDNPEFELAIELKFDSIKERLGNMIKDMEGAE